MNPAASLLGPLYNLYEGALGPTGGWQLEQLTLLGSLARLWWVVSNRGEMIKGPDIRPQPCIFTTSEDPDDPTRVTLRVVLFCL